MPDPARDPDSHAYAAQHRTDFHAGACTFTGPDDLSPVLTAVGARVSATLGTPAAEVERVIRQLIDAFPDDKD